MKIELKEGKSNGIFIAESDGKEAGRISYTRINDSKIRIDHTIVQEEFGGKGIGQRLVMELVKFAREYNLKVESKCEFAKHIFKKNEEIQDVLEG
jgi:predicted GNAT family acetyltransferase